jgi:hypothetical protein
MFEELQGRIGATQCGFLIIASHETVLPNVQRLLNGSGGTQNYNINFSYRNVTFPA